jgi:hypothetical protein
VKAFIDEHRKTFGVEPTCEVLQVALSTYWRQRRPAPQSGIEKRT